MGRARMVGTLALAALVFAAIHGGASWSGASALTAPAPSDESATVRSSPPIASTAPPTTAAGSVAPSTTMGVAQPIPPPPLSSSDKKLEVLDKIAIGLGLAACAAYFLTRRFRRHDDEEDDDDEGEEAPHPYTP